MNALPQRIAYLCLQATRQGQASHAHVHEIVNGLRSLGWIVTLFDPAYASERTPAPLLRRATEFLRLQFALFRSEPEPDILYIRSHVAALPIALWAHLRGLPAVQEVNGPFADLYVAWPMLAPLRPMLDLSLRAQLRWATAVVTVTEELRRWLSIEISRDDVSVITNGANTDLFRPTPEANVSERPYAIFFGALARWQGVRTLLAAAEDEHWPPDVDLVIAGAGVELPLVESAVRNCGHVRYAGVVPYREIGKLVSGALVGIVPKNMEADRKATGVAPLKLFETLACGVPAIVTDLPGQADVVTAARCGVVVPVDDPRAIARAVSFLHSNPTEAAEMGRRGMEVVRAQHSWERRAADTSDLLEALLGSGPRSSVSHVDRASERIR